MKLVIVLPLAAKALRKHRSDAGRILAKIEDYAADPRAFADSVKALQGGGGLRLRIGDYRVIFEETEVIVTKIGPRGSVYD
jgi:mRNA interferase RelE/StbE